LSFDIIFRNGSRYLVSSINEDNEILTYPSLTLVPGKRPWLLGVANVRGNLVPLIDLKQYLEGERTLLSEVSRVLLVRQSGGSVGLLIDEVLGQRNFSQEQRADAIGEEDDRYNRFVSEKYLLGEVYWGLFSMAALVRTPDFVQASA
jgi:twitching motility protein PilI